MGKIVRPNPVSSISSWSDEVDAAEEAAKAFNDSIGHAKELKLPPSKTEDGDTKTESSWAVLDDLIEEDKKRSLDPLPAPVLPQVNVFSENDTSCMINEICDDDLRWLHEYSINSKI